MNKQIRNIDLEKILFFDIETVRRNKEINVDSKEFELYSWSLRDKTSGFIPPANEVIKHYENNGALKPEFNKIVTVSVGYIKGTILYYKAFTGGQKEIIEQFYDLVNTTGFRVCGHNIKGFDLPTLRIKALEEGVDLETIPENINDTGKKPWEMTHILDTMEVIKGTYFYNMSLDALCMLLGIPSSKDDISGPYVSQVYYNEGVDRIAEYCNKDVIATAKAFCALQGKKDFITECVNRDAPKEEVNLLSHIAETGSLTKEHINLLAESGQDKEHIVTLTTAALSNMHEKPSDYEPLQELKDALYGKVDYTPIEEIYNKGTLTKQHSDNLIDKYKDSDKDIKEHVINILERFLTEKNKIHQVRVKKSLEYIKSKL